MKKLLNVLVMIHLSLITSINLIGCNKAINDESSYLETKELKRDILSNYKIIENFIINDEIENLIVDNQSNIYLASKTGKVYYSNGISEFKNILNTQGIITALIVDQNGCIYVGSYDQVKNESQIYVSKGIDQEFYFINSNIQGKIKNFIFNNNTLYFITSDWLIFQLDLNNKIINFYLDLGIVDNLMFDYENNIYFHKENGFFYQLIFSNKNPIKLVSDKFFQLSEKKAIFSLAIDNNSNIYLGTSNGLYKSDKELKSFELVKSISSGFISEIVVDRNTNILYAITSSGKILSSADDYQAINNSDLGFCNLVVDNKNNIYGLSNNNVIYKIHKTN